MAVRTERLRELAAAEKPGAATDGSLPGSGPRTLLEALARNAEQYPSQVAMREKDMGIWQQYTWRDYLHEVVCFALGLEERGFGPGDALLILGDNRPQLYFGLLGAAALRGYPTPVYPDATPDEILHLARNCGARYALAEDQEQVDKLLALRDRMPELRTIVYKDPRGLVSYREPGLVAYREVRATGQRRLEGRPDVQRDLIHRAGPDDVAIFLHSSGTTGAPKGVTLKHRMLIHAVHNARAGGFFEEREQVMAYLPMAWVGDFVLSVAAAIWLRFVVNIPERQETVLRDTREIAPTFYLAPPRSWDNMLTAVQVRMEDSSRLKRWIYRVGIPLAMEIERRRTKGMSPTPWQRFLRAIGEVVLYGPIKDHLGLPRVRRAYTGGEAIGEDTFLFFRGLGINLKQIYGQTESCALTASHLDGQVRSHTVGKPFPNVEIRVSEEGEILIRGRNVFDGYFRDERATAEAFQDGWFRTGDAGYFDENGHLVVLGRVSEVVRTASGERYVPNYIENRLKFSPYVKDAAVIGAGREYLTALICIDMDAVGHWAQLRGIPYTSYADLSQKPEVYRLIGAEVARVNEVLPEGLRIRRFVNLHKEFDPDDGEITRTRKLRRRVIEERYAPIIEALYRGASSVDVEARITYETGEVGTIRRTLAIQEVA